MTTPHGFTRYVANHDYDSIFEPSTPEGIGELTVSVNMVVKPFPMSHVFDDYRARIVSPGQVTSPWPQKMSDADYASAVEVRPTALSQSEVDAFAQEIERVFEDNLDGVYWLHPRPTSGAMNLRRPPIRCRLQVRRIEDWSRNHFAVFVIRGQGVDGNPMGFRSLVQHIGGTADASYPQGWDSILQMGDEQPVRSWYAPVEAAPFDPDHLPGTRPGFEDGGNMNLQRERVTHLVALHEFLHHLGLYHSGQTTTRDPQHAELWPYGHSTLYPEAWREIMGAGSELTLRHAEPWVRRLRDHGLAGPDSAYPSSQLELSMSRFLVPGHGPSAPVDRIPIPQLEAAARACPRCAP